MLASVIYMQNDTLKSDLGWICKLRKLNLTKIWNLFLKIGNKIFFWKIKLTLLTNNPPSPYQEKPQTRSHKKEQSFWCAKEEQLVWRWKRPLWELGTLTHTLLWDMRQCINTINKWNCARFNYLHKILSIMWISTKSERKRGIVVSTPTKIIEQSNYYSILFPSHFKCSQYPRKRMNLLIRVCMCEKWVWKTLISLMCRCCCCWDFNCNFWNFVNLIYFHRICRLCQKWWNFSWK